MDGRLSAPAASAARSKSTKIRRITIKAIHLTSDAKVTCSLLITGYTEIIAAQW